MIVELWQQGAGKERDEKMPLVHSRVPTETNNWVAPVTTANIPWADGFIKVANVPTVPIASEIKSYTYDANSNVDSITGSNGVRVIGYDALNRVTADSGVGVPTGVLEYDRNGNRTVLTENTVPYGLTYLIDSNRQTADIEGVVAHDIAGNHRSDRNGNRRFEYNQAGRLWQVYEGGQFKATYTYYAMGQRTRKVSAQGTTIYHYDISGNLIEETTATGSTLREYLYRDNIPVAKVEVKAGVDTLTYLHTDHLGTPRRATNQNGVMVWRWDSDAFGSTAANEDPDGDGLATQVNLRFSGQYYDDETGLHYNYFRYYDPNWAAQCRSQHRCRRDAC